MSSRRLPCITLPLVLGVGLMTGACGVPLAVSGAGYAADGGLLAASDKTSADHMISMVSKQDCALWRIIKGRAVCKPRDGDQDPYKVDYDDPQRMVAEDGVRYAPPLRAGPDAPATSWDAEAYKAPPAAPSTPSVPVTAVAETDPEPVPPVVAAEPPRPAAAAPAARPKKLRAHSVKKPSRRPAAPAS
jgi:hypothetical protein